MIDDLEKIPYPANTITLRLMTKLMHVWYSSQLAQYGPSYMPIILIVSRVRFSFSETIRKVVR